MTPLSPLENPAFDLFLLGVLATASLVASLFFLRFWRVTKDPLFLAFSLFFLMQAVGTSAMAFLAHPNEGNPWIFLLRMVSVLGLLTAILWKNLKRD